MTIEVEIWAYPARLTSHEGGEWVVSFDDFPEALTGAGNCAGALTAAADALEEAVLAYMASGREIPAPRAATKGEVLVVLDVVTAARAALARTMKAHGISNAALARQIRKSEGAVRRLVDGATGVKVDTVLEALAGTGAFVQAKSQSPALAFVK